MRLVIFTCIVSLFVSCTFRQNQKEEKNKIKHPSHKYNYVEIDTAKLVYSESLYAPVYSEIYHRDGNNMYPLAVTMSIRNTSLTDSAYISEILYYDSNGKLLKNYLDSVLLLTPLESIEMVVEEEEKLGGPGANFIITWGASRNARQILIQTIMIGTYTHQSLSFSSDAKIIRQNLKNSK